MEMTASSSLETARYLLSLVASTAGWSNWGRRPSGYSVVDTWEHIQWTKGVMSAHKVMADGGGGNGGTSR